MTKPLLNHMPQVNTLWLQEQLLFIGKRLGVHILAFLLAGVYHDPSQATATYLGLICLLPPFPGSWEKWLFILAGGTAQVLFLFTTGLLPGYEILLGGFMAWSLYTLVNRKRI